MRNHGYDVIVGGELFTDYSDHPRKLVTLNPKPQINRRRTRQLLPAGGCLPQAAWPERLSEKSGDAVALQQIKERGAWTAIDRDIRSGNRPLQQYLGLHCRALVMVVWSTRLTAWLQNSKKRAERSERLMYEQSHRDYLRALLSASSSACHGLLIITVITPLPTKPSATKTAENWSWRTRQLLTCRCVSVMLLRLMQNTRRS